MQNINDFVEQKGGGVAFVAGPLYTPLAFRHTPLAALFPVDLDTAVSPKATPGNVITEGFRVVPTDLGLASPQMQLGDTLAETLRIWQHLPELYWLLETPALKPAARVLAEHPTRLGADGRKLPVFSLQYVGAGKVLFHATDDTWRWRYPRGRRVLLALLGPDHPLPEPLEAAGQGSLGRTGRRSPPVSARRSRAHSGPVYRRTTGAGRGRRRDDRRRARRAQERAGQTRPQCHQPGRVRRHTARCRRGQLSSVDRHAHARRQGPQRRLPRRAAPRASSSGCRWMRPN